MKCTQYGVYGQANTFSNARVVFIYLFLFFILLMIIFSGEAAGTNFWLGLKKNRSFLGG